MDFAKSLPKARVFTMRLDDGGVIAWVRKHRSMRDQTVRRLVSSHTRTMLPSGEPTGQCNACVSNASQVSRFSGPDGALFLSGVESMPFHALTELRRTSEEICSPGTPFELVLVEADTFPPVRYVGAGGTTDLPGPFYHLTATPSAVTTPALARRLAPLWSKVQSSVLDRVLKFLSPGARASMKIIKKQIIDANKLERPEYWANTVDWVMKIQERFPVVDGADAEALCIFAMAIGTADASVHYNFQTAANLVDFVTMPTVESIAAEMDRRSDPATNQVSQLARAMAAKGVVEGKWYIGLTWDGKAYRDDLDIHVSVFDGAICVGTIYWRNKELSRKGKLVGRQDFDAGIDGKEDEPAENVTFTEEIVGKRVSVFIDNYTRRTTGDVSCAISICQQGRAPVTVPAVWPKHQHKGNLVHVADHIFTPIDEVPVAMSETQARAAAAQDAEWQKLFGTPTSTVATVAEIEAKGNPVVVFAPTIPSSSHDDDDPKQSAAAAQDLFASVVADANAKKGGGGGGKKKTFLSDHVMADPPTTVGDLFSRIAAGDITVDKFEIHLPDHVPGYIVRVETESDLALRGGSRSILSPCHYQEKGFPPMKPEKTGNARLDDSWLAGVALFGDKAAVSSISKVDGHFFLGLEAGTLSMCHAWPHAAGFYPQDLSVEGHKHRSKWSFLNTTVKPTARPCSDKLAIGSFLTSETATVFVNGQKMVLRVED